MFESAITEEAKAKIGGETEWGEPLLIEGSAVKRYVEAYGDDNPIYFDEPSARDTWYGGMAMPTFFLDTNLKSGVERDFDNLPLKVSRRLRGEDELEIFHPIRVGDTIRAKTKLVRIEEKDGKTGLMVFVRTETKYMNQFGVLVMVARTTIIKR